MNKNSVNMHNLLKPNAKDLQPVARNSDSSFVGKRLSNATNQQKSPYKRSNTKDERVKNVPSNH